RTRPGVCPVPERSCVRDLHDEKRTARRLADVVDRENVRMVQRGGGPGFTLESLARRPRERVIQKLDGDLPLQARIESAVDDAHASLAEERIQPVRPDLRSGSEARGVEVRADGGTLAPQVQTVKRSDR